MEILHHLRANKNTVLVVEHDPEIIKESDYVIDLGPKAGEEGGRIIYAGPYEGLLKSRTSLTAAYLTRRKPIPFPSSHRRPKVNRVLKIQGAEVNNLKKIDV